jgi:rubrerythrin
MDSVKGAIQTAIQMEKDGYNFYTRAAAQTKNDMARSLFESLSKDELVHLEVFQKLFENQMKKDEYDRLVESNKKYESIPVFPKDLKSVKGIDPDSSELDALRMAMDAEQEAIDYYSEIEDNTSDSETRKIINIIIDQEKNHYFLLENEFHHLSSTGYWYELDFLGG